MYVVVFSAIVDCVEAYPLDIVAMDEEKRGVLVSLLFAPILHDVNCMKTQPWWNRFEDLLR
jgi:hypothetical protein